MRRVLFVFLWAFLAHVAFAANPAPIEFSVDVMSVFLVAGCNAGTCHGNLNGKGGLRLSLRGQDPFADYHTLVFAIRGRRVTVNAPEQSLVLQKATVQVRHRGGARFRTDSKAYKVLKQWLQLGLRHLRKMRGLSLTRKLSHLRQSCVSRMNRSHLWADDLWAELCANAAVGRIGCEVCYCRFFEQHWWSPWRFVSIVADRVDRGGSGTHSFDDTRMCKIVDKYQLPITDQTLLNDLEQRGLLDGRVWANPRY
ncbi:MAG: hypothetical protein P8L85_14810 [Rubripirellula sp.]|nr:hypothetical protein [Rubripirellula sp.]